jgi:cytoskeletal protein CcmA (bactofilin family)
MGTISRQTTWSTGDTLTASDLNGEFDNILSTANGSLNADNLGVTAGQAAASKAIVLDSNKDFANTSSGNQIRNLTISGSLKVGTTFLPDASGGADLGSTSLEWGDVYIADDKKIYLGSDQDISVQYDETTNNALEIAANVEGAALGLVLKSDQGDDAGDEWKLNIADGGTLTLGNDIASAGTYVTHLTLTPNSTVSSSTLALAGALTVAGTASITGVATVGGITIGSAVINEAELETIDGITAGTVAASKAVVVDSNKDAASFRNVTLTGELDAATLDISGNADIDGTTNLDVVDIDGAVQVDATVTVGVDDQGYDVKFFGDTASAYLLWDTSADKLLTAGGATIDIVKDKLLIGGTAVTTTAAELNVLDAVTAGTVSASLGVVVDSNKDIASFRNVTLTGELDAATLDISGNADIDGTTNLDAVDIDGAVQVDATITVGADDQGYDIIFYGDAASANLTWDTSADDLIFNGAAGLIVPDGQLTLGSTALAATAAELNVLDGVTAGTVAASKAVVVDSNKDIATFRNLTIDGTFSDGNYTFDTSGNVTGLGNVTLTGELDAATLDISGNADIDGTTNLDAVDIDGAVQIDATVTVGVDDTGYDVKFFGATSGSSMLWDESADDLILTNAGIAVGSDATGDIYYRDANGFLARLAIGSDGQVLTSTGTVVNWEAAGGGGGGDFSGPGSATDNAIVRFNGTGGKTGQNSGVTIDDSNNVTGFGTLATSGAATLASLVCTAGGTFGGGYGSTGATISTAGVGQFNGALTTDGVFTAASLDISGNADIDGTLEADAITINGTAIGSIYGVIAGSSSIVTTGTVSTGTWEATDVGVAHGGTGLSTVGTNEILTGNGTGALTSESTLTFDGTTFSASASSGVGTMMMEQTGDNSTNPDIKFFKNRGSGNAATGIAGTLSFTGLDAANNTDTYAQIRGLMDTVTSGSEDGSLSFFTNGASNLVERVRIAADGGVGINETDPDERLHIKGQLANTNQGWAKIEGTGTGNDHTGWKYKTDAKQFSFAASHANSSSVGSNMMYWYEDAGGVLMTLNTSGNLDVKGSLDKASGSFKIDHPLEAKKDTHWLRHSFLEGPQADLIYRGTVTLSGGAATVNIDTAARMTDGTFAALNGNVQAFTSNETGWDAVRGSVSGNVLTIASEDNTSTASVSWMVVGERKDKHMLDTDWTDSDGRVITETEKIATTPFDEDNEENTPNESAENNESEEN